MQYIVSPDEWKPLPNQPSVFLAGGISGCPDWQRELAKLLIMTNYAVLNPRRKEFIDSQAAAEAQIEWEFMNLRKADVISFWFCKEAIQPIALYELGAWSMTDTPLVVGVEKGYPRELDVRAQTAFARPDVHVVGTIEDLAAKIKGLEKGIKHV